MNLLPLAGGLLLLLAACASFTAPSPLPTLSAEALAALAADPEAAKGQEVRVQAEIVELSIKDGKSLLTVSQWEPGPGNRPFAKSYGPTIVVESDRLLSPSFYVSRRQVTVIGTVAGRTNGHLLVKARELKLGDYAPWEKYYYPVPPAWYDYDPAMEHWYRPPYFDPWRGGRR